MRRCVQPASIAVVGASDRPGAFGTAAIANLANFGGRVFLVNPRLQRIGEQACHPALDALPQVPDCVVLAVPRDAVLPLVQDCARLGVGSVVVFASGFAETGSPEGVALQERLAQVAAGSSLRIFGPNCLGLANHLTGSVLSFVPFPAPPASGGHRVGIVSQSGALGLALSGCAARGVALSHVLTYGNGCDIEAADLIAYLAQDPECAAIACVFEGSSAPGRIVDAARLAREHGKPLVLYKIASGQEGARAALSHTGSLAGEDATYRVTLRAAGAVLVDDFESLMETAAFFAKFARLRPAAGGVAVIAGSGGAGIVAADKAELHGVPLPQPSAAVQQLLARHIPDFGAARNPCDVTAQIVASPQLLEVCAGALAGDDAYCALVSPQPGSAAVVLPRLGSLEAAARTSGKPVCVVLMDQGADGPAAAPIERNPAFAVFQSMDNCFATLAAWQRRSAAADAVPAPTKATGAAVVSQARGHLRAAPADVLTERQSKAVLAAYGIPVVPGDLASSADDAAAIADRIGYPVVLKIESADIPHKSDIGAVRLGLRSAHDVRTAHDEILAAVRVAAPSARIDGVAVQRMLDRGVEIVVGARHDPQFGPLVTVGLGGVLVELLEDVRSAPAPVTTRQAIGLLRELRGARLLDGFRGAPPVDLEALGAIVSATSRLVADLGGEVQELDINPVVCGRDGVHAVDALVVRSRGVAAAPEGTA